MGIFNDVFQGIFGGSQEERKTKDMTPAPIAALRNPFAATLATLFGGTGDAASLEGIPGWSGDFSAPMAPGEADALAALSVNDPLAEQRRALLSKTMGGEFLPGGASENPFLRAVMDTAIRSNLEGLEETLGRTLPGRFTLAGQQVQPQSSSAFDRAGAIATRGVANANADILTNLGFGAYESERGRQQEAIQLGQQEVQSMVAQLQAQALPRMIQDLGIERGLEEFKTRIAALLQALQITTNAPLVTTGEKSKSNNQNGVLPALGSFFQGIKQ